MTWTSTSTTVEQADGVGLADGGDLKAVGVVALILEVAQSAHQHAGGFNGGDGGVDASGNLIGTVGRVNYVFVTSNKGYATAISGVRASSMGSTPSM